MFLHTGEHVTEFAACRFPLVIRVTSQRAWVSAWRIWDVAWVTDSLQSTIPTYVAGSLSDHFWAHRRPFSYCMCERTDATRRSKIIYVAAWSIGPVTWVTIILRGLDHPSYWYIQKLFPITKTTGFLIDGSSMAITAKNTVMAAFRFQTPLREQERHGAPSSTLSQQQWREYVCIIHRRVSSRQGRSGESHVSCCLKYWFQHLTWNFWDLDCASKQCLPLKTNFT